MQEENRKFSLGTRLRIDFGWRNSCCEIFPAGPCATPLAASRMNGASGAKPQAEGAMKNRTSNLGLKLLRRCAMAGVGATDEAIDQRAKFNAGVLSGFGEQTLWREAGQRVDLQQVGLICLLVDHDVDAGQVTGADDRIG